jgi:hypothetical protein
MVEKFNFTEKGGPILHKSLYTIDFFSFIYFHYPGLSVRSFVGRDNTSLLQAMLRRTLQRKSELLLGLLGNQDHHGSRRCEGPGSL